MSRRSKKMVPGRGVDGYGVDRPGCPAMNDMPGEGCAVEVVMRKRRELLGCANVGKRRSLGPGTVLVFGVLLPTARWRSRHQPRCSSGDACRREDGSVGAQSQFCLGC